MPTLSRWFTLQYQRLSSEGKGALVEAFEGLRTAFFQEDVPTVLSSLPVVYHLTASFGEPAWHLAADYYAILLEMIWRGDLTRGLDLATQAMVRSTRILEPGTALEWYLRETLLDAWLSTDGRGYAADVLAAINELEVDSLPADVAARLEIVRAYAHSQIDPACGEDALNVVLSVLPSLAWEPAYCLRLRGLGLSWARRYDEAAADYEAAMREFEEMSYAIAANDSRLARGEALIRAGDATTALEVLHSALSAAERLPNKAHIGMAQGGIGQAMTVLGYHEAAYQWLGSALESLEGLGWLRTEAEYALIRAQAAHSAGLPHWSVDVEQAHSYTERLRSTDLRGSLDIFG